MSAERDAEEVRMLLAEAGYPHAVVHPSEDGDSPTVKTRDGAEVIIPDDVASTALALWANSHGLGHNGWAVYLVDPEGEPVEVIARG